MQGTYYWSYALISERGQIKGRGGMLRLKLSPKVQRLVEENARPGNQEVIHVIDLIGMFHNLHSGDPRRIRDDEELILLSCEGEIPPAVIAAATEELATYATAIAVLDTHGVGYSITRGHYYGRGRGDVILPLEVLVEAES